MSKPMLVTWPFVMLLLDYWPLSRLEPNLNSPLAKRSDGGHTLTSACAWCGRRSRSLSSRR